MAAECFIGDGMTRDSQADADMNIGIYGMNTVILGNIDDAMKATIQDNNTVRVAAGMAMKDGRPVRIKHGTTVDFTIPTGQQGTTTTYYLGWKIYTDSDGDHIEQVTSTTQTASGSLHNGDTAMYAWLYAATVNGVVLQSVKALCNTVKPSLSVSVKSGTIVAATEATLSSISASYSGGSVTVGTAASAISGITVTGSYSDGTTATITGWSISGTVVEGTNTFTITYNDLSCTVKITGVTSGGTSGTTTTLGTYKCTASSSLNVRSTAGGTVVGSINGGTTHTVYAQSGNWYQIDYTWTYGSSSGTKGWVSTSYMSKVA